MLISVEFTLCDKNTKRCDWSNNSLIVVHCSSYSYSLLDWGILVLTAKVLNFCCLLYWMILYFIFGYLFVNFSYVCYTMQYNNTLSVVGVERSMSETARWTSKGRKIGSWCICDAPKARPAGPSSHLGCVFVQRRQKRRMARPKGLSRCFGYYSIQAWALSWNSWNFTTCPEMSWNSQIVLIF